MGCTTSLGGWWSGVAGSLGVRRAASIGSFGRPLERAVELVFPEEQAVRLLRAAEEQVAAAGGVFSAGPGGIQVWSEPWNGDGGTSGSSVQLGSVEWTANAPTRAYITIHRCRVTRAGRARGVEPADLLKRVLELAGLHGDTARANLAVADPF